MAAGDEEMRQQVTGRRVADSLEVIAAAAQLPALEDARAMVQSEYDQTPEDSEQEADAKRRLDLLDQNIQRAEIALGIRRAT